MISSESSWRYFTIAGRDAAAPVVRTSIWPTTGALDPSYFAALFLFMPAFQAALRHARRVQRRKLLRRTQRQKSILSLKDLENIERRASSAYAELKEAWHFDYVIPNHDGEDSENWDAFYYPVGDAHKTLWTFAELVSGKVSPLVEKWEEGLLS